MDIFKTMKNGNVVNLSRPKGISSSALKGGLSVGRMGVSGVRSFNQYRVKQKEIGNARQQFYFVWLDMKHIDPNNTPSWEEYKKNIRQWIGKAGKENIPTILDSEKQRLLDMQSPKQIIQQPVIQPQVFQPFQPFQVQKTMPIMSGQNQQNKTIPIMSGQSQQNKTLPMQESSTPQYQAVNRSAIAI